jgi:transposase-like protein
MTSWRTGQTRPRLINVDGHASYPPAIAELKESGELGRRCQCRPCPYLNNVLERDHRFVKKRIAASVWFQSVAGALRTIAGSGEVVSQGQVHFIEQAFGIAV